jgi:small-conductance mechanosensitive channel
VKKTSLLFRGLGFVFQIVLPILLFGIVIPYTHGTLQSGLTGFGYFAAIVLVLVIGAKVKKSAEKLEKSLFRGIILAIFPLVGWVIIAFGAKYLAQFIESFIGFWDKTLFFIIIGRIFYLLDESAGE